MKIKYQKEQYWKINISLSSVAWATACSVQLYSFVSLLLQTRARRWQLPQTLRRSSSSDSEHFSICYLGANTYWILYFIPFLEYYYNLLHRNKIHFSRIPRRQRFQINFIAIEDTIDDSHYFSETTESSKQASLIVKQLCSNGFILFQLELHLFQTIDQYATIGYLLGWEQIIRISSSAELLQWAFTTRLKRYAALEIKKRGFLAFNLISPLLHEKKILFRVEAIDYFSHLFKMMINSQTCSKLLCLIVRALLSTECLYANWRACFRGWTEWMWVVMVWQI